jgi:cell division protein FtsB
MIKKKYEGYVMAWILFGLACLIIIILSIRLFIVSWQREDLTDQNRILQSKIQELKDEEKDLTDQNRILQSKIQELKDEEKDLTDQNKDLKNINKNLREKIMLESKLENKNSGISIGIGRNLQNKYGSLKIVENINFDVIDNRHYCNKGMEVFRQPGIFRQRLEKIEKQQISRRYRKIKSKTNDMSAPKPIDEDIKEYDEI